MAGNINNVIEKEQIVGDIQAVIDKILKLEDEIANTNAKSISITVDLKGAETISDLTTAVNEQREAIQKLTVIQNENKAAVNQLQQVQSVYGEGLIENVQTLVQQKQELAYVAEQHKKLSKEVQTGSNVTAEMNDRLADLTKRQMEVKQEVANTTMAIKTQVKESQSAVTSMENMSQKLGQLRAQFRSLNQEQRNSPLGKQMQKDIYELDKAVKDLDASIGNSQRNVGNYGSAMDKAGQVTDKFTNIAERMGIRMVASFALFEGGALVLQVITDKIKQMADGITDYEKRIASAQTTISEFEQRTDVSKKDLQQRLGAVPYDETKAFAIEKRKLAVLESQALSGKADKQNKEESLKIDEQIYEQKQKMQRLIIEHDTYAKQNALQYVERLGKGKAGDATTHAAELIASQMEEKIKDAQAQLLINENEFNKKEATDGNPKKDARKEMADRLKLVKDEETAKMLAAQKTYDESKKTFVEERQLEADKIAVAKDAYTKRTAIVNEFRVKAKLSDTEYKDHLTASKNDENEIILKANEVSKKIDDEIHKRHLQADADSIKYIDSLKKQRAEIEKLTTDLENLKATNAIELRGAGFHLFGDEASNFNTQADSIRVKIKAAKEAQDAAASGEAGEGLRTDKAPDLATILKFKQERIKAGQSEAEAQHELDMLYADQKKKVQEEIKDKTIELAKETMSAIITIQENQFAKESQMLAIKQQKEQTAYDQKKEAIQATAGYAIDKDNQLSKLAAQHAAAQNEIQQEQNQLALRKAKFEKQASIANIIAKTAEAEAANLVNFALNPIEAGVIAGIIAATGAVELAAASSAPLPQFFKGGITETPIFTAGERGREMMVTPQGELSLTPSTTTVYKAPIGTRIFNNDDTERMIKYAANHVTSTSQQMPVITVQGMDDKKIVGKLDEIAETIVSGVFAARTPAPNNNIIVDEMRRQANLRSK